MVTQCVNRSPVISLEFAGFALLCCFGYSLADAFKSRVKKLECVNITHLINEKKNQQLLKLHFYFASELVRLFIGKESK